MAEKSGVSVALAAGANSAFFASVFSAPGAGSLAVTVGTPDGVAAKVRHAMPENIAIVTATRKRRRARHWRNTTHLPKPPLRRMSGHARWSRLICTLVDEIGACQLSRTGDADRRTGADDSLETGRCAVVS
ncbi:hypothetical protein [Caballeronia sp. INML2]|uniref:hypothetical protein n=1 Tax=Caballeronia sp. INML2 TaxID=2921748 RepID=UPI00202881C8|nr:hypothetical protein [Caballeronia sp. INML2]